MEQSPNDQKPVIFVSGERIIGSPFLSYRLRSLYRTTCTERLPGHTCPKSFSRVGWRGANEWLNFSKWKFSFSLLLNLPQILVVARSLRPKHCRELWDFYFSKQAFKQHFHSWLRSYTLKNSHVLDLIANWVLIYKNPDFHCYWDHIHQRWRRYSNCGFISLVRVFSSIFNRQYIVLISKIIIHPI